jgi:hypothetical protein
MTGLDVQRAVIPIVSRDPDGRVTGLLGTGFFVGRRRVVVTAAHVFKDSPLAPGHRYAIAFLNASDQVQLADVGNIVFADTHDMAFFRAESVPGSVSLPLSSVQVGTNVDVLTYEYSSTSIHIGSDGKRVVQFSAFTHKGNVLRHYVSDFPERTPTPVLDTSFPALQGASGAPIVRATDFAVVGMLVANHERHLVPAQVVRIESNVEPTEETKYFLPTGKALEATLIIEFLSAVEGVEPEVFHY